MTLFMFWVSNALILEIRSDVQSDFEQPFKYPQSYPMVFLCLFVSPLYFVYLH